jgi:hypothetical protein
MRALVAVRSPQVVPDGEHPDLSEIRRIFTTTPIPPEAFGKPSPHKKEREEDLLPALTPLNHPVPTDPDDIFDFATLIRQEGGDD